MNLEKAYDVDCEVERHHSAFKVWEGEFVLDLLVGENSLTA